jgi:uncharacterized membrane protein
MRVRAGRHLETGRDFRGALEPQVRPLGLSSRPIAQLIGAAEVICGIGILIRKTRLFATALIMILMTGAIATHVMHGEFARVLPPLILIAATALAVVLARRQGAFATNRPG